MFAHYKNVRWHIRPGSHQRVPPIWAHLAPWYSHLFNLRVKPIEGHMIEFTPETDAISMMMRDGAKLAKPRIRLDKPVSGSYVTTQFVSANPARTVRPREELAEGKPIIDLDTPRWKHAPLIELFSVIAGADMHIGADSGCAWIAATYDKPIKLITNPNPEEYPNPINYEICMNNIKFLGHNTEVEYHHDER